MITPPRPPAWARLENDMTDLEIIEKLAEFMGWQFTNDIQIIGEHSRMDITTTVWFRRENGSIGIAGAVTCHDFNPLHDPVACALVLDEIERRRWKYELHYVPSWGVPGDKAWYFVELLGLDFDQRIRADSDNRYRTVCLAVLAACQATEL